MQQWYAIEQTFRNYLRDCLSGSYGKFVGGTCPLAADPSATIPEGTTVTDEDVDAAYKRFQDLTRQAVGNPHAFTAADPDRPVLFDAVVWGVFSAMYDGGRSVTSALSSLVSKGDAQGLLDLSDSYFGRTWNEDTNTYSYSAGGSQPGRFSTLVCLDTSVAGELAGQTEEDINELAHDAAPWLWSGEENSETDPVALESYCTQFATSDKLLEGRELPSLPPTLVAGGTFDFATPFWNSVVTADAMNGYLLIVAQNSHGTYSTPCASYHINHFYRVGAEQFDADFKAGRLKTPEYTGAANVRTKNVRSEEIIGDQCQLISFRDGAMDEEPGTGPTDPGENPGTDPTDPIIPGTEPTDPGKDPDTSTGAQPGDNTGGNEGQPATPKPSPIPSSQGKGEPGSTKRSLARTGADVLVPLTLAGVMVATGLAMQRRRQH